MYEEYTPLRFSNKHHISFACTFGVAVCNFLNWNNYMTTITLHHHDIPADLKFPNGVAVDTETQGLNLFRDRLCLVQLSCGDGTVHLVQIARDAQPAPNLCRVLADEDVVKIFHFGRFDIAALLSTYGVITRNVFCTKIASKFVRTYTDKHSLKELCREYLGLDLSKMQQCSDWASDTLTLEQQQYAAADVLYLHQLKTILTEKLERESRMHLANACFGFLPFRVAIDMAGWAEQDIFSHA
jgi:ribonuclease D